MVESLTPFLAVGYILPHYQQYVQSAASTLNSKSKLQYIDVNSPTDSYVFQLNSYSGGVINWQNFVSAFVINTNSIAVIPYTYSNLVYVALKNSETLTNATPGRYKVRVWYRAE